MAKLPQYRSQVIAQQATTGPAPVDTSMSRALGQAASGLSQLAQAQSAMQQREANTYTVETKNQNTVAYTTFETELRNTAQSGSEYAEGMTKFIEKQKQAAMDNAPSPKAAEGVAAYFSDFNSNVESSTIQTVAKMNAERSRNAFEQSLDLAKTSVYLDPSQYQQQADYLAIELENSNLPEVQKERILSGVSQELNRSRVLGDIQANPHNAVKLLYQSNEGLSASDHEMMLNEAVKAQEAANSSAIAEQKAVDKKVIELEKQVEQETAMNGYELIATDALSFQWVTSNRENLKQEDYKYFINRLETPDSATSTDVSVYSNIYSSASSNPAEAKVLARKALVSGELTIGDFNKINTIADQSLKGELPTPYKQATSYMRSVSRTNELNPPVGAGERFANAQDDFNMWYSQNENATAQEAVNKSKEIWKDYSLVDSPVILSQPKPYGSSKGKSDLTMQDVADSAKKLQKSYNDGVVNEQEYNRQLSVIIQWKKYLEGKDG